MAIPSSVLSGFLISVVLVLLAGHGSTAGSYPPNLVCFYTDLAYTNNGSLKVGPEELKPALDKCTHLVYQYAQISKDFEIEAFRPDISSEHGLNLVKKITDLKIEFPKLKVLISLAAANSMEAQQRYVDVIHEREHQEKLVRSILAFIKKYNFDGINLGWIFPAHADHADKSSHGSHHVAPGLVDNDPEGTRVGFGKFIEHLTKVLKPENFSTTVFVIPQIDYVVYYDIPTLSKYADLILIESHDFPTPSKKFDIEDPKVPIYYVSNSNEVPNIEKKIQYFLEKGADARKLIVTVASYGSWALIHKSDLEDSPTRPKYGAGGIVFYFDVCSQIKAIDNPHTATDFVDRLSQVIGHENFRESKEVTVGREAVTKELKDDLAVWLAYEDVDVVAYKTAFAKRLGLGGMALNALMFDDTRGTCTGVKYPLLETIAKSWK